MDDCGLPYGKLGFRTKGFRGSAEKASRMESTCFCMSGMGQACMHFSRTRMCLVKYSRASVFNSGSGEVRATYDLLGKGNKRQEKVPTYQIEHDARQNTVESKVHAPLHALKPVQPV